MNVNERDEISASVAAHAELGPRYDAAVAEGLVERIGDEIDKRIDARLGGQSSPGRPGQYNGQPLGYQGAARVPGTRRARARPSRSRAAARPGALPGQRVQRGDSRPRFHGARRRGHQRRGAHHPGGVPDVLMVLLIWLMIAVINVAHSQRR